MQNTWNQVEDNLEECICAIQNQGQSIEECLASHPEQARELEPLVQLSVRLQAGRSVQASQEFKRSAFLRLQNLADVSPNQRRPRRILSGLLPSLNSKQKASRPQAQPRRLAYPALAGLFLVLLGLILIGATVGSAQAVPGDALYPLKRAQETIQLALAFDPSQQAGLHLVYANRRMEEAAKLLEKDETDALSQILDDYNEHMQQELIALASEGSLTPKEKTDLANDLLQEMAGNEARLAELIKAAPQSVQSAAEKALTTSRQAQNKARQIILGQLGNGSQPIPTPTATSGRVCGVNDPCLDLTKPAPTNNPNPGISTTEPGATFNPTRISATPTRPASPGILPNASPTPAPTRPPGGTTPAVKVTPTPGETRTPSTSSNDSVIQTRTATPGKFLGTQTPQVSP